MRPFADIWLYVVLTMFALISVFWAVNDVYGLLATTGWALRVLDAFGSGEDPLSIQSPLDAAPYKAVGYVFLLIV